MVKKEGMYWMMTCAVQKMRLGWCDSVSKALLGWVVRESFFEEVTFIRIFVRQEVLTESMTVWKSTGKVLGRGSSFCRTVVGQAFLEPPEQRCGMQVAYLDMHPAWTPWGCEGHWSRQSGCQALRRLQQLPQGVLKLGQPFRDDQTLDRPLSPTFSITGCSLPPGRGCNFRQGS